MQHLALKRDGVSLSRNVELIDQCPANQVQAWSVEILPSNYQLEEFED
jgi:GTP cyclohydrolase FolE2